MSKLDTEIRATGRQVGDEALAIGERKAQEYLSQRINRDDNIWDGPLTDNRCEARAKAARAVAEAYKSELIKNADSAADQLQSDSSKSHTINQIRQQTNQCLQMLATQRTTTLDSLNAAEEQSLNQLSETMEQLLRSIGQTLQATMQTLRESGDSTTSHAA